VPPEACGFGQESNIAQCVQIDLDRQLPAVLETETAQQFVEIGVALPLDAAQAPAIFKVEPDEIAPAPMIGTENQLASFESRKCLLDILGPEIRTIATHDNNLGVAEIGQSLDRVLKPLSEGTSPLAMHDVGTCTGGRRFRGSKDVDIKAKIGPLREFVTFKKRFQSTRPSSMRAIEDCGVGKDEKGMSL
jgi:hypothetical protein